MFWVHSSMSKLAARALLLSVALVSASLVFAEELVVAGLILATVVASIVTATRDIRASLWSRGGERGSAITRHRSVTWSPR